MGFWVGKVVGKHQYEPSTLTKWLMPTDVSANEFNGLGHTEKYRPNSHFHGPNWHPWKPLANLFGLRALFSTYSTSVSIITHKLREMYGHKPIAAEKAPGTAESFTREMKEFALNHDYVDMIGVTRMKKEYMFAGQENVDSPWIIAVALSMDYDELAKNLEGNFTPAVKQVIGGYERTQRGAMAVANWIRSKGYYAKAYGGGSFTKGEFHLAIPPAIDSGIGQLAKNGSMISDVVGGNFRLSTVLTDMPLVSDAPRNIGVDEFCVSCKKCTEDCPPGALSDKKQMVRGVEKWYVDYEKCLPFITEHKACGICLSTCPWSRPGLAPGLSQKMLKKMARKEEVSA